MTKYIRNFVTGHGISFEKSKRNMDAFDKASRIWPEIASKIELDGRSVVIVCGAKNNGKSSFLRYLLNSYVGRKSRKSRQIENNEDFEMVDGHDNGTLIGRDDKQENYAYYVDYDPGQCEMTAPGVVSAHIIRASSPPLTSPSYLNLGQHELLLMASVGGLNMSVNPRMYIKNARYIFNEVKRHRDSQSIKKPIFINTMGHIRNVGLAMLTDLIKICQPTDLVVLNVETDPMRTIYADLGPSAVDSTSASFYYDTNQRAHHKLDYKYHLYNLGFSFVESTSIATKNRTALQLAYIASITEALYKPIMQVSTRWISMEKVSIHAVSSYPLKEGIVLELLIHSWVHLVRLKRPVLLDDQTDQGQEQQPGYSRNETSVIHAEETSDPVTRRPIIKILDEVNENTLYGCGIVADIDIDRRLISVITPLDQDIIDREVDCLIKPLSIQVPPEMFTGN